MTETIDQPISQLNEHVAQLFRQGRYQAALPLAQQACELARGQAGNDALALGESLNHLANLHRELGNYTQAEQPYLEALKIKRAALGRDHPDFESIPGRQDPFTGDVRHLQRDEQQYRPRCEHCLLEHRNQLVAQTNGDSRGAHLEIRLGFGEPIRGS